MEYFNKQFDDKIVILESKFQALVFEEYRAVNTSSVKYTFPRDNATSFSSFYTKIISAELEALEAVQYMQPGTGTSLHEATAVGTNSKSPRSQFSQTL